GRRSQARSLPCRRGSGRGSPARTRSPDATGRCGGSAPRAAAPLTAAGAGHDPAPALTHGGAMTTTPIEETGPNWTEETEEQGFYFGPSIPKPTTDDRRTVYERMVAVIGALPAIGKTQRNQQQGFMFRGHDDVMNALNPLLAEHGVFIVPKVLARETATRSTDRGKTMYEVNLHVGFTFYGLLGDSFTASGWGEGTDMGDKATN